MVDNNRLAGQDRGEEQFSIQEREDDMLIARRDWQFGWRCIARRPKAMTNEEWRPEAERIVTALSTQPPPVSDEDEPAAWAVEAERAATEAYASYMGDPDGDDTHAARTAAARAIEQHARQALAHAAAWMDTLEPKWTWSLQVAGANPAPCGNW